VLVGVVIGVALGWKWVLAPLLGYAVFRWSLAMLRSMVADGRAVAAAENPQPRPASLDERVLYWCEECGAELVLIIHGSGKAPRHCGTGMHERAELLSN
jgi:hypothetical protein